jgi:predicted nucleic acid-binding protein
VADRLRTLARVRPIASDTSVLLPGLLSPAGQRRKLLVLLAYGGLSYYARVGLDELELLQEQARRGAGELGGPSIEELVERAIDRKAAMAEHLPALAPDDLMLVGSPALFDEVEAKVEAVGPRMLKGGYDPEAPAKYRRQLEVICGLVTPPFALDETPEHTQGRDRKDDFVIETGFQGGALAIVSDDKKHIALEEDETVYRDPRTGNEVPAYWPSTFIERFVNTSSFDINDVDGELLELAVS